ncbi:phosphotransferase [Nocardia sp. NPDC004711]
MHGDFSPKNVLVGTDGLMVLDFELAHVRAAVFELAFLHRHLALKAVHVPRGADRFGRGHRVPGRLPEHTQRPLPERLGSRGMSMSGWWPGYLCIPRS